MNIDIWYRWCIEEVKDLYLPESKSYSNIIDFEFADNLTDFDSEELADAMMQSSTEHGYKRLVLYRYVRNEYGGGVPTTVAYVIGGWKLPEKFLDGMPVPSECANSLFRAWETVKNNGVMQ